MTRAKGRHSMRTPLDVLMGRWVPAGAYVSSRWRPWVWHLIDAGDRRLTVCGMWIGPGWTRTGTEPDDLSACSRCVPESDANKIKSDPRGNHLEHDPKLTGTLTAPSRGYPAEPIPSPEQEEMIMDIDPVESIRRDLITYHANADHDAWDDEYGQTDDQRAAAEDAAAGIIDAIEVLLPQTMLPTGPPPFDSIQRVLDYAMPSEHADYERTRARAEHATETRSQMMLPPVPHPELDSHIWHDLHAIHRWLSPDQTPGGLQHQDSAADARTKHELAHGPDWETDTPWPVVAPS